jgi:hypothetical protein
MQGILSIPYAGTVAHGGSNDKIPTWVVFRTGYLGYIGYRLEIIEQYQKVFWLPFWLLGYRELRL